MAAGLAVWTIAPALVACVGVAPMQCLQYQEAPGGPWLNFYGAIENFRFVPGERAELLVRFHAVDRPPADGASRRVVLVRELSRVRVPPAAP